MKPVINNHKIDYNKTVFALLKVLDLNPRILVEHAHSSKFLMIGVEFKNGEMLPVKEYSCSCNDSFINAVAVRRYGIGNRCNCMICEEFEKQDEQVFLDFYKSNFEDDFIAELAWVTDALEDALQEVLEAPSGLLINSQTSRFGDTYVGSAAAWEKVLDGLGYLDENAMDELSDATREDLFLYPNLD